MIHDLSLALSMHDRCKEIEFVVSEKVLQQVMEFPNRGIVWIQMNVPQEGFKYRFVSRVHWRGLLFIHPSRDPICFDLASTESSAG